MFFHFSDKSFHTSKFPGKSINNCKLDKKPYSKLVEASALKINKACNFIKKESLSQVFSSEFCEISMNTFFYRTPPVAASLS